MVHGLCGVHLLWLGVLQLGRAVLGSCAAQRIENPGFQDACLDFWMILKSQRLELLILVQLRRIAGELPKPQGFISADYIACRIAN